MTAECNVCSVLEPLQLPFCMCCIQLITSTFCLYVASMLHPLFTGFDLVPAGFTRPFCRCCLHHCLQVGAFYETVGIDAVLVMDICGLNPMGNTYQAGCQAGQLDDILGKLVSRDLSVVSHSSMVLGQAQRGLW